MDNQNPQPQPEPSLTREQAYTILTKYLVNPNLIKHSLAAEAAMKALCKRINPQADPQLIEKWGIVGLLHDGDYEIAKGRPEIHGMLLMDKEPGVIPPDIAHAIRAHNYQYTKVEPQNDMDWAIACADQLTGFIVAATLIHPSKKIANINAEFVFNRYYDKGFAKGADRKSIEACQQKLGIPLTEFVPIVLTAMQGIADQLGL